MSPSAFHGIFSSLNNREPEKPVFSMEPEEIQAATQQPMQPSQTAPQAGPQVGRVAVDIFEFEEYYIIKAPIAGVRLADLDIEVNDNVLTIRGTRKQTDDVPQGKYYLQECFWGEFSRSVTLPFPIDARKIKATFNKDSILKILIPKEEKVKIVRISEG